MKTTFKVLAIAVALVATASGCRTMTGRTAGENIDNKVMVATVKAKLVGDRIQNLGWVNVDANDGVVYLSGNSATAEQKERATELAQKTHGVQRVVNNIVVNSEKTDAARAPSKQAAPSSASSTGRPSNTAAASPATTSSSAPAAGTIAGEVVTVNQGTGDVTLRTAHGGDLQLRLPPSSVRNIKPGDRLSVAVNSVTR